MDAKEQLKDIADFVVDLLTDERGPKKDDDDQPQPVDPNAELFQTDPELADALDRTAPDRGGDAPEDAGRGLRSIVQDDDDDAVAQVARIAKAAPVAKAAPAPQPVREVVHNVVRERVIQQPQVTRVTEQHTNNTFFREGDTIVDNRILNNITAEGEHIKINLNQDIENRTTIADDGGIAAGGSIDDSALNTGRFEGVQAGDDVDAEEAIIGDENTAIDDSEVGAFSGEGDATNAEIGEDDDERRPTTGKLPEEEGPVNDKATDGDRDVLKEDVDLDFEDEASDQDAQTGEEAKSGGLEDTTDEAGRKSTDEPTGRSSEDTNDETSEEASDETSAKSTDGTADERPDETTETTTSATGRTSERSSDDETDGEASPTTTADDRSTSGEPEDGERSTSQATAGDAAEQGPADGDGSDELAKSFAADSGSSLDGPDPLDADGDGLLDNPDLVDADGDGVLDNPERFDADGDGLIDRPDLLDLDNDGEADFLLRPADTLGGDDDLDLDFQN